MDKTDHGPACECLACELHYTAVLAPAVDELLADVYRAAAALRRFRRSVRITTRRG